MQCRERLLKAVDFLAITSLKAFIAISEDTIYEACHLPPNYISIVHIQ